LYSTPTLCRQAVQLHNFDILIAMAGQSPNKKAKTGDEAYYKVIDGNKYDRGLLEAVEKHAESGGQISRIEAMKLWADAEDGRGVTDIEKATLEYAMKTFKFTDKAISYLRAFLDAGKHTGLYKVVDGKKYDRSLFEMATKFVADGVMSFKEAKALFEDAQDGKGITGTEKDTLEYILKEMKFTDKARQFLEEAIKLPDPKSYYKQIDGHKYDAGLILAIEDAAKDGLVSDAEAKRLWKDALDGKGVTDIEKATLKYAMATYKFTDAARTFLQGEVDKL